MAISTATATGVADWLSAEELATLRANYAAAVMIGASGATLVSRFPPAQAYVSGVLSNYTATDGLAPRDRERCLIALLSLHSSAMGLAVHIYWGLMEGLEPTEVGHTLLLTAAYNGVDVLANGIMRLQKTLGVLRAQVALGADACKSPAVLGALLAAFP